MYTIEDINDRISTVHSITLEFKGQSNLRIEELEDKIRKFEDCYHVNLDFFTGNPACFPYIRCETIVKNNCIEFVNYFYKFLTKKGLTVNI